MYLVDEEVIINKILDCKHAAESRKLREDEFLLIMDTICPQLFERLCKPEFASTYPMRGILIYESDKRETHAW